jgi:hypothetical protein
MNEYNRKISELLFEIESKQPENVIDKAYDYIERCCDNMDECYDGCYYDFSNAVWGIEEETIIAYLNEILEE